MKRPSPRLHFIICVLGQQRRLTEMRDPHAPLVTHMTGTARLKSNDLLPGTGMHEVRSL